MNSFKKTPMTKEQRGEAIELAALFGAMGKAVERTRQDICLECLDRRCESGQDCKEFLRRSKSYAWEIVAASAELN